MNYIKIGLALLIIAGVAMIYVSNVALKAGYQELCREYCRASFDFNPCQLRQPQLNLTDVANCSCVTVGEKLECSLALNWTGSRSVKYP